MTICHLQRDSSETRHAILIVDDEADFIATSRRMLKNEPYRLITATSGKEALELLQKHRIDLVVCDCLMPEMDGVTLLSIIQKRYGRIITVMLTAAVDINIAVEAVNTAGVYKFFTKPVEWCGFKIMLRRALESRDLLIEKKSFVALRERAERRLKITESKIEAMSEAIHDAMIMIDDTSKILFWNTAAEKMFGISADKAAGKDIHELLLPSKTERTQVQVRLKRFKDTGEGHIIGGVHEFTAARSDGTTFAAEVAVSAFQIEKQWYLVGTIRDITRRKQIESHIQRTKHELQQILDTAQVGILVTHEDSVILQCNDMAAQMLGFTSALKMKSLSLLDLLMENEKWDTSVAQFQEAIKYGQITMMEVPLRHRTGDVVWCTVSAKAERTVFCGAHEHKIIWTISDVSELRRNKEIAENCTRVRSEFLAKMSHEIRTPLTTIMGFNGLVLQTELTEQQYNYLSKSSDAAESLLNIVNDILDFSKIDAGKLDLEIVPFRLDEVLGKLSNVISLKAERKGLKIIFEIAPSIPASLVGDPLRIGQVLLNLVNNAIKFTEKGEISIAATTHICSDHEVLLEFSVKDTGIGMNRDQLERLFKPFLQADNSTSRKYGGTGLGLAICKNLVQLMGGEIWAESQEGVGSIFAFTVRLGCNNKKSPHRSTPNVDLKSCRVLVVDDNPVCRTIFTKAFALWGVQVETAGSGREALEVLKSASVNAIPFRFVILDWKMHDISGVDTIRAIQNDPELRPRPKILVATAYGLENVKQEANGLLIDGFLEKPVQQHVLYTAFKDLLSTESKEKNVRLSANLRRNSRIPAKRTVLVVDDEPLVRETLKRRLRRNGYNVHEAADGFEAGVKVLQLKPDLVVLDLAMQPIDGFAVCRSIRKNNELNLTKILVLTGNDSPDNKSRAKQLGADGFIMKTANSATIMRCIEELFREHDKGKSGPCLLSRPVCGLSGISILVVEDNDINQELIKEILLRSGLVVTLAKDGLDAVRKVNCHCYDLVLMDVLMPVLDGLAATKQIRASGKSNQDLPIIAMTAAAMVGDKEKCLEAGMDDYIAKPVKPFELIQTIRRWVKPDRKGSDAVSVSSTTQPAQPIPKLKKFTQGLHGISFRKGLEISSGNEMLYSRLLESFEHKFARAVQDIRKSLRAQRTDEGVLKAHTLKSVAESLGCDKLASDAAELENLLKSGESDVAMQLMKVEGKLKEVLDSLNQLHGSKYQDHESVGNLYASGKARKILMEAVSLIDVDFSKALDLGEQFQEICAGADVRIMEKTAEFAAALYEIDHVAIRSTAVELDCLLNDF